MKIDEILNAIDDMSVFSSNFQTIVEVSGLETAKHLIKTVGGLQFYVPRVNSPELVTPYIIKRWNEFDPQIIDKSKAMHKIVLETQISEKTLYKILNELIANGVLEDKFNIHSKDNDVPLF